MYSLTYIGATLVCVPMYLMNSLPIYETVTTLADRLPVAWRTVWTSERNGVRHARNAVRLAPGVGCLDASIIPGHPRPFAQRERSGGPAEACYEKNQRCFATQLRQLPPTTGSNGRLRQECGIGIPATSRGGRSKPLGDDRGAE